MDNSESQCTSRLSLSNFTGPCGGAECPRKPVELETSEDIFNSDNRNWKKSSEKLPGFTHEKLRNKVVKNSRTIPDKMA